MPHGAMGRTAAPSWWSVPQSTLLQRKAQPGGTRRRKVQHNPRVFAQPALNQRCLVRRIVVPHQMYPRIGRCGGIGLLQTLLEFLRPVMAMEAPPDLPSAVRNLGQPPGDPVKQRGILQYRKMVASDATCGRTLWDNALRIPILIALGGE